jgi:spore cortex formation protein SpoVR/YcgB (stage V sporulation)
LYFIEKNAPLLKPWQREIIRIVRKIAQYFYPQAQTKVMNEGWATFWHYTLMNALYDEGLVTDEFMLEIIQNHSNVIAQPDFDSPYYAGINPYSLGFNIFKDIQRISQSPTEEDKQWFSQIADTDWLSTLDFSMRNFKDESFIAQYLSPKVIRDLRLFSIVDDDKDMHLVISAIHDQNGYQHIRDTLSRQYNLSFTEPNIQVYDVDVNGTRGLTLRHYQSQRRPLHPNVIQVLSHLHSLWQFPVFLESVDEEGEVTSTLQYPLQGEAPKT